MLRPFAFLADSEIAVLTRAAGVEEARAFAALRFRGELEEIPAAGRTDPRVRRIVDLGEAPLVLVVGIDRLTGQVKRFDLIEECAQHAKATGRDVLVISDHGPAIVLDSGAADVLLASAANIRRDLAKLN